MIWLQFLKAAVIAMVCIVFLFVAWWFSEVTLNLPVQSQSRTIKHQIQHITSGICIDVPKTWALEL